MRKRQILLAVILVLVSAALISWGVTGHRAIGKIAENHLSPRAKAAVRELLGNESLADVSTWADEVRNQPEYRQTGSWHYLNLPLGLSFTEFAKQVEGMEQANVYSALLKEEGILGDKTTTRAGKIEALKFIVHFVGDLHQPMHVSRAEDKGGNTIQLNYEGQGTNLHSLWDTKLLEHQGLTYEELAEKYSPINAAQIRQWQSDRLIKWVWESYEISSRLYAEIDAMKSRNIDDSYYQAHLPIIQERIEKAGIRLAGVLNEIFTNELAYGDKNAQTIEVRDAANHINDYVNVCAVVYGYKVLDGMTLVNLGADYPNQLLTMVLKDAARDAYKGLSSQHICITGKIVNYKGRPEIVITDPKMISQK